MKTLLKSERTTGASLAFVYPKQVLAVTVRPRDDQSATSFQEKFTKVKAAHVSERNQLDLFETDTPSEMKHLEYLSERVCVEWLCSDLDCGTHTMQVLDWEICEVARRDGVEAARSKVEQLLSSDYHSGFMLGNFNMYRHSFAIIGLWYPKRNSLLF